MADSLNRRDFLVYGGATIAGVTLGEAGRRWLARADARLEPSRSSAAAETWAASVCRECPAACGVRVRLMDGTPIKLEGNPSCPIARGALCAKGQAALEGYFDPDRLAGPARRTGRRGAGSWARISWGEALNELARRLEAAGTTPGAVLALGAEEQGPIADAWSTFWTTRHADVAWVLAPTAARLAPAFTHATGAAGDPVFDLERATHVISFGAPIVEDWLSPVWAQRSYGRFRRGPTRPRGRLVQIEDRRSLTARKADEWLPVAADRQVLLAYGLASVLLREDRIDRRLLADIGGNLAEVEPAIVTRYTPDAVALATGVPVVTLLRLARDLTATPRPVVVVRADAPADLVEAVFVLNALVGALDRPGGVLESSTPAVDRRPQSVAAALGRVVARNSAPRVVALRDASALRAMSAPLDVAQALDRAEFIVSFSPYLDEAAALADLLLPTHTPLESWHALVPPATDGRPKLACAAPAVTPRLDTRDLVEVLAAAAAKLHDPAPAKNSGEAVRAALARVWALHRGAPYTDRFETEWVRQLESGGWWVPPAASEDEFVTAALGAGGWIDPFFEPGQLREAMRRHGGVTLPSPDSDTLSASLTPPGGAAPAPDAVRASVADREFPLRLVAFTPASVNLAGGPNQPVLFELLGQPDGPPWRAWAELGPDTARTLGIETGTRVRVSSLEGVLEVVAVVVDGMPSGVVAVAYVPRVSPSGRWARLVSSDVRALWGRRSIEAPVPVRVVRV